jgi:hypothetical protein
MPTAVILEVSTDHRQVLKGLLSCVAEPVQISGTILYHLDAEKTDNDSQHRQTPLSDSVPDAEQVQLPVS